jgi:queuine/archaeosine tRNA-ribosyltransferase
MADIRAAIFEHRFTAFATRWLARYERAEGVI